MNGSDSPSSSGASSGLPASLRSASMASSRARAPRRSGEKYRWRNVTRLGSGKTLRVLREPAPQLVVRRLAQRRCVLHDELHLLRQAALDDGVVLVEAQRHRLAGENLLADLAVEEIAHLLRRGRALPLRHPGEPDLREVVRRNHNAIGILALTGIGIERVVDDEQRCADQQDMQQRLAQPSPEKRWRRLGRCGAHREPMAALCRRPAHGLTPSTS